MRWMSFAKNGHASFGLIVDGGVADAASAGFATLKDAIAAAALGDLAATLDRPDYGLDEVTVLPTITSRTRSSASGSTTVSTRRKPVGAAKTIRPSSCASRRPRSATKAPCCARVSRTPWTTRARLRSSSANPDDGSARTTGWPTLPDSVATTTADCATTSSTRVSSRPARTSPRQADSGRGWSPRTRSPISTPSRSPRDSTAK